MNILLLCNRPIDGVNAATITDHMDAFVQLSRHRYHQLSIRGELPAKLDLSRFDAIVIHYTILLSHRGDGYLSAVAADRIAAFSGLKVAWIHDEYHRVNEVIDKLEYLRINVLFSLVPPSLLSMVYPLSRLPRVRKETVLAGYVSDRFLRTSPPPIAQRPVHVGYRGRRPPYWLGAHAQEKVFIGQEFQKRAQRHGLATDISVEEHDRIYGRDWIRFLCSCRATLGVESGASIVDCDGELERKVDSYLADHPSATFAEVRNKFLEGIDGSIVINPISPRAFEAAATKTAMVLFEGTYSGILQPWRHYIPLKKDFSNFEDVVAKIKDPVFLQDLVDRTYQEIALNSSYHYRSLVDLADRLVEEEAKNRSTLTCANPYSVATFRIDVLRSGRYVFARSTAVALQWMLLGPRMRRILFQVWRKSPVSFRTAVRPALRFLGR